jgi:hypothetical protein
MSEEVKFRPIPSYGHRLSIKDFIEDCDCGNIMSDDGHGYFATNNQESDVLAIPESAGLNTPVWATQVIWYGK